MWAGIRTTCKDVEVFWEATASPGPEGKSEGSRFLESVKGTATGEGLIGAVVFS